MDQAKEMLRFYGEFIKTAPDELTIQAGFLQTPEGMTVLFLHPVYCGSLEEGEQALKPLCLFATPLVDQIQLVMYDDLIHMLDAPMPKGRHYFIQTQSLDSLGVETVDALLELAQQFSSPFSAISLHHFHGAASRVAPSETAFALRQDHLLAEIIAAWEPPLAGEDQRHLQWAQSASRTLAPYALKGGYINLLDEREQERVPFAFGSNYERLLQLKRTYDPDDVFHSTIGHITPT
ncbi:BBE domain-containing protein [Dictyobacter halimunensis]